MMKRLSVSFLFIIVFIFLTSFPLWGQTGFQPSATCATCHEKRHSEWKNSAMTLGMNDLIFVKFYELAPEDLRMECLSCHSPAAFLNKDMNFELTSSKENMQCDFCHTAKNIIKGEKFDYYEFDPGFMKRGNLKDPETNLHEGVYSPLHTKSVFCSVCHGYKFMGKVALDRIYGEWAESEYADTDTHCQDCHMRPYTVKYGDEAQEYYRHTFDGPMKIFFGMDEEKKSGELISDAIEIVGAIREFKKGSEITVSVVNDNAGHYIPASSHGLRRFVVETTAFGEEGKIILRDRDKLGLFLSDNKGGDAHFFWNAATIKSDTRIPPGKKRNFVFTTELPVKQVKVKLYENLIPEEIALKLNIQKYGILLKETEFP